MPKIGFYRQARYDGGMRTGFGIDDQVALQEFTAGDDESDPALLWYVDIGLEGKSLPTEPSEARDWLIERSAPFVDALRQAAERLEIGLDDTHPYRFRIKDLPKGVRGDIIVSGVRRLPEGELARRLVELAESWSEALGRLTSLAPV